MPVQCHCKQLALSDNITVPCDKPYPERILHATSSPVITKAAVIDGKIVFKGYVQILIEYVACIAGKKQLVIFKSFKEPFADFVEHPHARHSMKAGLTVELEYQDYQIVDKRTISKFVVLKICVSRLEAETYEPKPHPCEDDCIVPCPPPHSKSCPDPSLCENGEGHGHHQCHPPNRVPKYCMICGLPLHQTARFCVFCGKAL